VPLNPVQQAAIDTMASIGGDLTPFRVSTETLDEIRHVLDTPSFAWHLNKALIEQARERNLADGIRLRVRRRLVDERAKQMDRFKAFVHQVGVAGGAAFVAASLVQLAMGQLKPEDSLLVWVSALFIISFGFSAACVLDERRVLFEHISERLKYLAETLEKDLVALRV
jgi:hypothetical protein